MKWILLISAICLLNVFPGCRSSRTANPTPDYLNSSTIFPDTRFVLDSIIGQSVNTVIPPEKKIFISFDHSDGKFSGFAGCNRFFGNLNLYADSIRFGMIVSTKMACPDLEFEQSFLELLGEKTFLIQVSGNKLILSGEKATLKFEGQQSE